MAADDNPAGAPTRRAVIGGLAALTGGLAGATLGGSRGAAATVSAPVRVGDIDLMVVSDGTLAAPRAFALPQTPPAEVEALYRAHGAEAPLQFVSLPVQLIAHMPRLHTCDELHAVPQAPQCAGSLVRSTHVLPQRDCPVGHGIDPSVASPMITSPPW